MSELALQQGGIFEGVLEAGLRLSELPESEGGWAEYFTESDYGDLRIDDDYMRASTALVMENAKRWMASKSRRKLNENGLVTLDEATRSALVGGFSDYIFPIIRAGFPTNPITDLVSVQVTTRKIATVVYWNWIVGGDQAKGSYTPGMRLFDANTGKQDSGFNFSNEVIDAEVIAQGDGAAATYAGTLVYHDGGGVAPGTVSVTAIVSGTAETVYDNGNGGFLSGVTGSIDYKTGAVSVTFSGAVDNSQPIIARYRWDSEGSQLTPQVDVQITTSTVETERRAMKLNYSMEAVHDILQEFGVSLEPNLITGAAEQMNFEIARQLIHEMWQVAPVVDTFAKTPGASPGFNITDHYRDFAIPLNNASNKIWAATQKGYGNWLIVDEQASTLIESLPAGMFQAAPRPANVQGLHYIGTLLNKFRVYKDIHLDKEPNASPDGNVLMGYKGNDFYQAGLVWSPYQMMYTTETLVTADFLHQKGLASRYATKMVNPNFYVRINLTPSP